MTQRICLGKLPDNTYGLMISKPGYDVMTTTTDNLLFDSRAAGTARVIQRGTISFAASGSLSGSASITGADGRAPLYMVGLLSSYGGNNIQQPIPDPWTISCSSTTLSITRTSPFQAYAYTVVYVIFSDAAA